MPNTPSLTREQFEEKAQQLTTKVESNESVSDELNKLPFQERLALARRMDDINGAHRDKDSTLPDLELTVEKDEAGSEHLTDMKATTSDKYLGFIDSSTKVYDLPEAAKHNNFDYILNTQLTRDTEDSKHLGTDEDYYEGTGKR